MKAILAVLVCVATPVAALAAPHFAFRDLPEALVLGEAGCVGVTLSASSGGWTASFAGSLSSRVDATFAASPESLFDPEIRVLLVRDLLPAQVLVTVGLDCVSYSTTLLLGPVHVSFGRTWGPLRERWAAVEHALNQRATVVLGLDERSGTLGALLGVRIYPWRTRLWGVSLLFSTRDGLRLTIGGIL